MSYIVDAQKNGNIETFKLPLAKSLMGAQCLSSVPPAEYGKCSKISNTLKLRTPNIIAENNF